MEAKTPQAASRLALTSILLGLVSISPLLVVLLGVLLGRIFNINPQWLSDFLAWLGSTRLVVYLGWLSMPGLIFGIIALIKGISTTEKGFAIIGIILGLFGILWTYFISSMLSIAQYL